jgi:hypothetical protein
MVAVRGRKLRMLELLVRRRQGNDYFHNGEPPINFFRKLHPVLHGGFTDLINAPLCESEIIGHYTSGCDTVSVTVHVDVLPAGSTVTGYPAALYDRHP